jgi:hypothetical protein
MAIAFDRLRFFSSQEGQKLPRKACLQQLVGLGFNPLDDRGVLIELARLRVNNP